MEMNSIEEYHTAESAVMSDNEKEADVAKAVTDAGIEQAATALLAEVTGTLESWKSHPVYDVVENADFFGHFGNHDDRNVVYLMGERDALRRVLGLPHASEHLRGR